MLKVLRPVIVGLVALSLSVGIGAGPVDAVTAHHYANCKALNAKYPHGVGLPGAHDKTSGVPVTNFTRNRAVYLANTARDRDKDKIACEKH